MARPVGSKRGPTSREDPSRDRGAAGAESRSARALPILWSVLPALMALAVYLLLAPAVPGDGDSSELTLALALDGIAHPTGYPLYTLLGGGFVHAMHALGAGWAYAASAWSALGGGVTVFFLHALAVRLVPPEAALGRRARFLVGLLPLPLFALNPAWTDVTTASEVYSWHLALVGGMCLFFVGLVRRLDSRAGASTGRLRWSAVLWGLLCGAGLAHHVTAAWVFVPLSLGLLWALWKARRLRAELVWLGPVASLVPLSSYALLYFRAQGHGPANWPTLGPSVRDFYQHATGAMYRYMLGRFAPYPEEQRVLAHDIYPFLFPVLALLVVAVLRARWNSIPSDSGMVFWPDDGYQRLRVYQWLQGEKRDLEVINTTILTNPLPRERFIRRHGFDPFEGVPLPRRGDDPAEVAVFFDTLYRSIDRRTRPPVILFDPAYQLVSGRPPASGDGRAVRPMRTLAKPGATTVDG